MSFKVFVVITKQYTKQKKQETQKMFECNFPVNVFFYKFVYGKKVTNEPL